MKTKLKTIEEHNKSRPFYSAEEKTGIACPRCGTELVYPMPTLVLTSHPPRKLVSCRECHYQDTVLA